MKQNERNIIDGGLLPVWITSIPNTFGTMASCGYINNFLLMSPKKVEWLVTPEYTVCHLLLTGFLKWSNFPHQSKENNWNCFSLFFKIWSNDLYFDLKINFFFREIIFFLFLNKNCNPTIVQLKYLNVLCAKWRRWD
jgi:hypothetical protein